MPFSGSAAARIATHPSDVAVALVALDAVVHTRGPGGERAIGIDGFFLLPGDSPIGSIRLTTAS
jgi:xanthine dehydrogenase YagS FAD-binding subunit